MALQPRSLVGADESDREELYWSKVRAQFEFRDDKVPMNAANLCPSPRAIAQRVTELTRDIDVSLN